MQTVKPLALALLLSLLAPLPVTALDSDGEQPIEVEADRLEMREQDNVSVYEGNVRLVQGSLTIQSDRLVIHFNDAGELTLMEMTGNPARFRQLDNERREMLGEAEQIDYLDAESKLELRRSARFSHAGDLIKSDLIRIDTRTNDIAAGGRQSDERVKMVITPKQNSAKPLSDVGD